MSLENLIKQLEQGICPNELNYRSDREDDFDWNKVRYNTFYKSNEYFESKLPEALQSLPAFDKIIDLMVEKNKNNSPLKEMEEKQNISKEE